MLAAQKKDHNLAKRRENPNKVACLHRLSFAYSNDKACPPARRGVPTSAKSLVRITRVSSCLSTLVRITRVSRC